MFTVKRVEFGVVCRAVFGTVPPAPIASFACEQRLLCIGQSLRARCSLAAFLMCNLRPAKGLASVQQQFPSRDVFRASNPHIEADVDTRRGEDAVVIRNLFHGSVCLLSVPR